MNMATVNVNRKVTDNYYRYKMPKVVAKVEGRGNGIKTLIVNLSDIAKSLKRPVKYVLKYIGIEVGASSNADTKSDRYVVNGVHNSDKLQTVMDGFIEKFVLCFGCGNPETQLFVYPKKEKIYLKCTACGHLTNIPITLKLSSFMLKNPPEEPKKQKTKGNLTKNNKHKVEEEEEIVIPDEDNVSADDLDLPEDSAGRNDDFIINSSLIKVRDEKRVPERLELLETFIKNKLKENNNLEVHFHSIMDEVKKLSLENKFIFAICSCIFDDKIAEQLRTHSVGLSYFTSGGTKIQMYLLQWLECFISSHEEKMLPFVSNIFKMLYDFDIVDEEAFVKWNKKTESRYVKKDIFDKIKSYSQKFMDWLENAEEESSEEESVEDTGETVAVDIEFTTPTIEDRQDISTVNDEEGFNIDDI